MKTLNFVGTGIYNRKPVLIDFEKHTVDSLDALRAAIDDIYIAPEDIEIRYKKNEAKKSNDFVDAKYSDQCGACPTC